MILDELVKRATRSSNVALTPLKNRPPLVFAICSEGPQHELWAQYTVINDGEQQFNMVLLNTCHGVILKQVESFFVQVQNGLNWTAGPFLKSVVDRLGGGGDAVKEGMGLVIVKSAANQSVFFLFYLLSLLSEMPL